MNLPARLLALSGPLQGTTIPLPDSELSVGREDTNHLTLNDPAVSRRHCIIHWDGKTARVRDLGSSNRTKVNSIAVEECSLQHGDEIAIGASVFVLLTDAHPNPAPAADSLDIEAGTTVLLQRRDAVYLRPEQISESGDRRVEWNLKALLRVSAAVAAASDVASLLETLMESVAQVIPADRGAVLLANDNGECEPAHRWQRSAKSGERSIPSSLIRRAATELVSLCLNDILSGPDASPEQSVVRALINSVLVVPVVARDQLVGILYLDSSDAAAQFDESHLQLLTGIAGIVAVPLANAIRLERLENEKRLLESQVRGEFRMVGDTPAIREVYGFIRKVAPSSSTVLIGGESGTGKELVARAIHYNSPRASRPFVAINCAAITDTLLESELFGHEKGAFTGAAAQKRGKFEEANGGTVFLDEIGEMAPLLQAKLLRVLQEREFERVGGTRPIRVDIRVVAATNRDLLQESRGGRFRQDLYYRLNVVSVKMPALRERRPDIPVLVQHFLEKHSGLAGRRVLGLSPAARACLMSYDWPGNVRELENAVERAIVLGSTDEILVDDLPGEIAESSVVPDGSSPGDVKFHETIREVKRQLVMKAFDQADQDHTGAARLLGIHPNNLHRLVKTLGLKGN